MANTVATIPDNWPNFAVTGDRPRPADAFIAVGFPYSTTPPTRQQFNWAFSEAFNGIRYSMQRGIPDWSATETYATGARVQRGGLTYRALSGTTNQDPAVVPATWERWGYSSSEITTLMNAALAGYVTPAQLATAVSNAVTAVTKANAPNPITGLFGTGKILFITQLPSPATFIVPAGITSVRVRICSAGANGTASAAGAAGGWSIKTITVTPGSSQALAMNPAGTGSGAYSFGASFSVSSAIGTSPGGASTGDINYFGGSVPGGANVGGAGAANAFGPGAIGSAGLGANGVASGGGGGCATAANTSGGPGGNARYGTGGTPSMPTTATVNSAGGNADSRSVDFFLDQLGAGAGGAGGSCGTTGNPGPGGNGANGGGGGAGQTGGNGGWPGGGGGAGNGAAGGLGAGGFIAIEW